MPTRDPFTEPFCRPEDLGLAIPDSDHAVSVCLPRWRDVIGYEEGDPEVIETFECGYPRFVAHPYVAELFLAAQQEFAKNSKKAESALVFPSLPAAWRCADYVKRLAGAPSRLESYGWGDLTAILLDESAYGTAWKYWQHSGEIVSSRLAESALTDAPLDPALAEAGRKAEDVLRSRIADLYPGTSPGDVFLLSSGMAAISAIHRCLSALSPGAPSVQIEFPYIDAYKLQEQFGGIVDLTVSPSGGADEIGALLASGQRISAVYTELPSNPLLRTADLAAISPILRQAGVPLVIDDTIATAVNVEPLRFADAVTTSLTKLFSGVGDVAAGSVVLNPESPFYESLREAMATEAAASPLFLRDAIALEVNSRHFAERVAASNANADELVPWLRGRKEVAKLWHPTLECRSRYDQVRRENGGYGGLLSIELHGGEPAAAAFYDALAISKGPSLGTNYSLVSPYTLLAHYQELEWADQRGAPRNLIRIWIGLEEPDDLIERFDDALACV
ncbi:MAG TPA: PLP-dependent transferase [Bacteroidia bacterium]|nr:PLP-dependent transferase [Bacteroidia bacterium]